MLTTAGHLPAKYVIHTVGPVYSKVEEAKKLLSSCYRESLFLTEKHGLSSIAFPNISTGIYGYPKEEAAQVAIHEVKLFLKTASSVETVLFVCYDPENYAIYEQYLKEGEKQ